MRIPFWILLLFLAMSASQTYAQKYRFQQLTVEDGLSDNIIHNLLMDKQGFIWMASHNGLCRYDGTNFKYFRHISGDSSSIGGHVMVDVVENEAGILWIGSNGGGLNRFDPETEQFTNYNHRKGDSSSLSHTAVTDLFIDGEQQIWVATFDGGLNLFDQAKGTFKRYPLTDVRNKTQVEFFKLNSVRQIIEDVKEPHLLWLATHNGIYRLNKKTDALTRYAIDPFGDYSLEAHSLVMDQAQNIWAGTIAGGLIRLNTKNSQIDYFPYDQKGFDQRDFSKNQVNQVARKSPNELWISTQKEGLGIFDMTTERFSFVQQETGDKYALLSNDIYGVYQDRDERLWVRHSRKGINILDPSSQIFPFVAFPSHACSNTQETATSFAYDGQHQQLYALRENCNQIFRYDEQDGAFQFTKTIEGDSKASFYKIFATQNQKCWITSRKVNGQKALYELDLETETIRPFTHAVLDQLPIQQFDLTAIYEDTPGRFWIGTNHEGLIKMDLRSNEVAQYVQSEAVPNGLDRAIQIQEIKSGKDGHLWLATLQHGVFSFDPETEKFRHFPYHPEEGVGLDAWRIMSLEEASDGRIWVGTSALGIQVLDPKQSDRQKMEHLDFSKGLSDDKITGIVRTGDGGLWISTVKGLSQYDATMNQFVIYDEQDGLDNSYLDFGMELLSNDMIVLGQPDGFYAFDPKKLFKNESAPPIVFTSFNVFEKEKTFEKSIHAIDEIVLRHDENFFSISFAALNFSQSEKNRYAYQLEGYDNDWIYPINNRQLANYTNVGAGNYSFKVKGANNDGVWNETGASLKIRVLPPWWWNGWSKLLYFITIVGLLAFAWNYQKRKWALQTALQLEQEEAKRLKELDGMKTRLYTNITHEFRTPLTVIMGMVDQVKGNEKEKKMIRRNSESLLRMVNQMLDLSKVESGNLELNLMHGDVVRYLHYLTESFQSFAASKNLHLTFYAETATCEMDFDEDKVQHIVYNLLSNAIKFTPNDGQIVFHVRSKKEEGADWLEIKVKDSGVGISADKLPYVFDRFYQGENSATRRWEGTGIGLAFTQELVLLMKGRIAVESEKGRGSEFIVSLPIAHTAAPGQFKIPQTVEAAPIAQTAKKETDTSSLLLDQPYLLIIEDNPDVATYIQSCLSKEYRIQLASDGQAGIDLALETVPDIIISDLMMPKKDGFEVCQQLKSDERTSHIPIILLTAKATLDDRVEGLGHGADAYLTKPFHKEELLVRVKKLIELRQQLQKYYGAASPSSSPAEPSAKVTKEAEFIQKMRKVVENQLHNPQFNMAILSKEMLLSHTQIYRKVKALTNLTPSQFIRKIRLQEGMKLLKNSDKTVSEVAYETGFSDPNYFSRTFSDEFGFSPSAARK